MSVIVLGMEMPSYCAECDAEKWDENEYGDEFNHRCGFMYKGYTHKVRDNGRLEECPLRPLPNVHGDLIDRDATRGSIKPWSPEDERNACTFDTVKKLLKTMLDHAPTIVEAEGD